MRIINGRFKGRRIPVVKNLKARPTTDFAKESLFNILENQINLEGIQVLDLFGGSGSISLEFSSRGAEMVHVVDFNRKQISHLSKVAGEWSAPLKGIHIDVFEFINIAKKSYDIVFADPPYQHPSIYKLPQLIIEGGILKDEGLLIIEHSRDTKFDHPSLSKQKKYGKVHFSFFNNFKNKSE